MEKIYEQYVILTEHEYEYRERIVFRQPYPNVVTGQFWLVGEKIDDGPYEQRDTMGGVIICNVPGGRPMYAIEDKPNIPMQSIQGSSPCYTFNEVVSESLKLFYHENANGWRAVTPTNEGA